MNIEIRIFVTQHFSNRHSRNTRVSFPRRRVGPKYHTHARLHILDQVRQSRPHLLSRRQDLRSRQDETIVSRIPQLDRHGVIRLGNFKSIVYTIAGDLIDGVADRTAGEGSAVHSFEGCNGAVGEGRVFCRVGYDA